MATKIRIESGGQPFEVQETIATVIATLNSTQTGEWFLLTRKDGKKMGLKPEWVQYVQEAEPQ